MYIPTKITERTEIEERRLATEGRPRLGEVKQTLVRIPENTAFKVSLR